VTLDDLRAQATLDEGDFKAWDSMAVEIEVAELLYALVRQSKPDVVVECGSGKGYASRFIAEALDENHNGGWLYTYEQDYEYAEQAMDLLTTMPATVVVNYSHVNSYTGDADLVFIDSLGGEPRERDMDHWFACAARPVIVIHDAAHYPPSTFARGEGVLLQAGRGVWIGRARA